VGPRFFNNPHKRLLDVDASQIPGSPFSKPMNTPSNRPSEPLAIAKYASTMACGVTLGWIVYLLFSAIWYYSSAGRIVVEVILALLSFFGLFWNSYFIVASVMKCFIPKKAFLTNTKYCSIIPETAPLGATWMNVTIQIPVYKEGLKEVLMPTLNSCMAARDYYVKQTGARCNIVVCDDGMMAMLRDNFPAAEMLWKVRSGWHCCQNNFKYHFCKPAVLVALVCIDMILTFACAFSIFRIYVKRRVAR
jgi:hypothetical protein